MTVGFDSDLSTTLRVLVMDLDRPVINGGEASPGVVSP
jgi:hypothetical protein